MTAIEKAFRALALAVLAYGFAPASAPHVASPEVLVDDVNKRTLMWVHGQFCDGKRWPDDPIESHAWLLRNGYNQVTQVTVSTDGLHFKAQPAASGVGRLTLFYTRGAGHCRGRCRDAALPLKRLPLKREASPTGGWRGL